MRFTKRILALLAGGSAVGVVAVAGAVNGPDGAAAPDPVSLGSEGTAVDIEGDEIRVAAQASPVADELDSANTAGERVEIAVSDDGPGIPAEDLPHVFERLYRGSKARTGSPAGAGLGLSIAASLVEAMGGDIRVESEPGRGTMFLVALSSADSDVTEPIASRS